MVLKKVADYLLRVIGDYLSNRWVIYEGDKWSLKKEITSSAPQWSRVGPLVWNVMYDDFLRLELPAGTSIISFADDALVVCVAEHVGMIELRIPLKRARLWWSQKEILSVPEDCSWRTRSRVKEEDQVLGSAIRSEAYLRWTPADHDR